MDGVNERLIERILELKRKGKMSLIERMEVGGLIEILNDKELKELETRLKNENQNTGKNQRND